MDNNGVNDLLARIRNGDDAAFEILTGQYAPLITSVASSFSATARDEGINGIFPDLSQELTLALYRAARSFRTDQDRVTFGNYAKRCLNNCAISFLRKMRSAERRERKVKNTLKKQQKSGFYPSGIPKGDGESALNAAKEILSPFEYTVFAKYIDGSSVAEISAEVGRDAKSVSNAIYRSKAKVKRFYENRNSQ